MWHCSLFKGINVIDYLEIPCDHFPTGDKKESKTCSSHDFFWGEMSTPCFGLLTSPVQTLLRVHKLHSYYGSMRTSPTSNLRSLAWSKTLESFSGNVCFITQQLPSNTNVPSSFTFFFPQVFALFPCCVHLNKSFIGLSSPNCLPSLQLE